MKKLLSETTLCLQLKRSVETKSEFQSQYISRYSSSIQSKRLPFIFTKVTILYDFSMRTNFVRLIGVNCIMTLYRAYDVRSMHYSASRKWKFIYKGVLPTLCIWHGCKTTRCIILNRYLSIQRIRIKFAVSLQDKESGFSILQFNVKRWTQSTQCLRIDAKVEAVQNLAMYKDDREGKRSKTLLAFS